MSLLPETARRVDEIAARAQAEGRTPSLALAVVRDRAVLHFAGVGAHPVPDSKTQYRIGSITKTLTATMVMQMRDEGFFALDDLLYRHLPGTPIGGVTLRQLLGHVSGLQREPDGPWWERNTGGDVDKLLADLGYDKLAGPPFRRYRYSNLAYGLLGAVLERVTGESWANLVGKRVLDPLGMKRTTYSPMEPFARGTWCTPWTAACTRSRGSTPGRWRRPASCGRRPPTWRSGRPSSPIPRRPSFPARPSTRCAHPS